MKRFNVLMTHWSNAVLNWVMLLSYWCSATLKVFRVDNQIDWASQSEHIEQDGTDVYAEAKKRGMFKTYPRTEVQQPGSVLKFESSFLASSESLPRTRPSKCSLQITVFQRKISEFWENLWKFHQILLFFNFFWKLSSNFQKKASFWENPVKNW